MSSRSRHFAPSARTDLCAVLAQTGVSTATLISGLTLPAGFRPSSSYRSYSMSLPSSLERTTILFGRDRNDDAVFVGDDVRLRMAQTGRRVLALELAGELVAADAGEIVALLVEEQRLDQLLGVVRVLGLARTQLLVDFLERVFARLDVLVFLETVDDQRAVVEQRQDRFVGLPVEAEVRPRQRAHEGRDVDLAVLVDADADRFPRSRRSSCRCRFRTRSTRRDWG